FSSPGMLQKWNPNGTMELVTMTPPAGASAGYSLLQGRDAGNSLNAYATINNSLYECINGAWTLLGPIDQQVAGPTPGSVYIRSGGTLYAISPTSPTLIATNVTGVAQEAGGETWFSTPGALQQWKANGTFELVILSAPAGQTGPMFSVLQGR